MVGEIFDIKEMSVHDGPGVRITVFLKGCPLRCSWCHNPEGMDVKPVLLFKKNLCTKCGKCFQPCSHPECQSFHRCVHACPNGCLSIAGKRISDEELAKILMKKAGLLKSLEGGVTFSGGEPLLQHSFLLSVMEKLPGMHKAIQTSGYSNPEVYRAVVEQADFIMQDLKIADPAAHYQHTGVEQDLILKNVEYLKRSGKNFIFRIPLIPGITDTEENLKALARITEDYPTELLPYNTMAGAKYEMIGKPYPLSVYVMENAMEKESYFRNAKMAGNGWDGK